MKVRLRLHRRTLAGRIDAKEDGFLRQRCGACLVAEALDDVAVAPPHLHERPAARWVKRIPQVMRQGVGVDADVIARLRLLRLALSLLDLGDPRRLVVRAAFEFYEIGLEVR